ncbi:uncharacterized protein TNCV_893341 [Trichonephila clavipes]|nr:uncharacterized protein TNCV_893341 [Trichonephila clavipes]
MESILYEKLKLLIRAKSGVFKELYPYLVGEFGKIHITRACGATSKRYLRFRDFDDFKFDNCVFTNSALQIKSFLLAKSCLDCPVSVVPHKSLNSCQGVIFEPDLLTTTDAEILNGFSGQGVIQVRRITIKKDASIIPTKHIILTFNSPKLPTTIKAGYLNCKIRPYIPNPLRCFKFQRFGHSQTAFRGQLTCSRCASVGHASPDCKARKLIGPQPSQTYARAAKSITVNNYTQTDENITKIKCPPLQLLPPLSSVPHPNACPSIPSVSTSSTTQANLLPSASSIKPTTQIESRSLEPISASAAATDNNLNTSTSSLSIETCPVPTTSNKFAALSTDVHPSVP